MYTVSTLLLKFDHLMPGMINPLEMVGPNGALGTDHCCDVRPPYAVSMCATNSGVGSIETDKYIVL